MRTSYLACALVVVLAAGAPAQSPAVDLQTLLHRAAEYVAVYEDRELGNVVAAETYIQNASPRSQRRMESDFLIVLIGGTRMGVRKVNRVDGKPVTSAESSFEAMMDDSPEGIRRRMAALKEESTRYNIGPILRQMNLPTFALKVLRRDEAPRFAFERRDTDKINGIEAVEVRFREWRGPTLVHGDKGESLLSSGTVWIEPATGRVLKTEFNVENPNAKAKGRITVTYTRNTALNILVPEEMREQYSSGLSTVDCTAKYSNFRSFQVDVKTEIGTSPKP